MNSLEVRELSVAYGNAVALEGINLSVEAASVVCILGANGAGKTSFLKCVVGLVPARSGRIIWEGEDITNLKAYEAASRGVAMSPEGRRLFPDLTVYENLCVGGYLRPRDASFRADLDKVMAYFPHLRQRLPEPCCLFRGRSPWNLRSGGPARRYPCSESLQSSGPPHRSRRYRK